MLRLILIEKSKEKREVLSRRLRAQGYIVEGIQDSIEGANRALVEPPAAVIADLWMPGVSGIQLCRLLRAEPATSEVPVILRADTNAARNRFWAERAGAAGYVVKGRMGELVRTLARVVRTEKEDTFFTHFAQSDIDIRDRIATYLDEALFASVLASEVRALSTCGSFERLFDLFSQLVTQVTTYRWMAIISHTPRRIGLHTNPANTDNNILELPDDCAFDRDRLILIEDEDAFDLPKQLPTLRAPIEFGQLRLGEMLLSPTSTDHGDNELVKLLAREMSGPLRIVGLVEESQWLASIDAMTGLYNRRAMQQKLHELWIQNIPLTVLVMDIDHFKQVNDNYGHAAGDLVLGEVGRLLKDQPFAARWGGEEFLIVLTIDDPDAIDRHAQELLTAIRAATILHAEQRIAITASIGGALRRTEDTIDSFVDRADRAMYQAKTQGRDRFIFEVPTPDALKKAG